MRRNVFLQHDDLHVIVRSGNGAEFIHLPAVGVASRCADLEGMPFLSDAPPGEGPLYVLMVRAPHMPDDDDEAKGDEK